MNSSKLDILAWWVKNVNVSWQVVPRFIGEWGDVIITLKDGTKVDLRSVPKFREIAKYCLDMAEKSVVLKETGPKGFWEYFLQFTSQTSSFFIQMVCM